MRGLGAAAGVIRRAAVLLALTLAVTACGGDEPRPAASPSATTTPPQHGRLVYATDSSVAVVGDGAPTTLVNAVEVVDLVATRDGRYAAWLTAGDRFAVTVLDVASGAMRTWTAPDETFVAYRIGAARGGFVVVGEGTDGRLATFDPARTLAGDAPAFTTLRGVTSARLVAAGGDRLLVATGEEASAHGGPETVYDVAADGATTRLFTDGDELPEGTFRNLPIGAAALTADGARLVYATGTTAGKCDLSFEVVVRDLAAGRVVPAPVPPLPGDVLAVADTITTGPDGRTVLGLTSELGGCPQPRRAAAYVLQGDHWAKLGPGVTWVATGVDLRRASLTLDGDLAINGRRVGRGVEVAAWAAV